MRQATDELRSKDEVTADLATGPELRPGPARRAAAGRRPAPDRRRRRRRRGPRAGDQAGRHAGPAPRGRRHAGRPHAQPPVEAAAARGGGRQHGRGRARARLPGPGALAPLPLPLRRDGRARPRREGGDPRADLRRGRARDHRRARSFRYDTLVIAVGSVVNDFGTPGVKEHAIALDQTRAGGAVQPAPGQRLHPRARPGGAGAAGAAACRDHRRRRDGDRALGRAAPHRPGGGRLRARPGGPGEGHQDHADRGRGPDPAGLAAAGLGGGARACCGTWVSRSAPGRGSARCGRTACSSPTAASSRRSSSSGRPA